MLPHLLDGSLAHVAPIRRLFDRNRPKVPQVLNGLEVRLSNQLEALVEFSNALCVCAASAHPRATFLTACPVLYDMYEVPLREVETPRVPQALAD
jgi:hypothetical protein